MKTLLSVLLFASLAIAQTSTSVKNLNNIRFADQFATIQSAITDASTTGAVIIPSSYAGLDSFTNPNSIFILDLRTTGTSFIPGTLTIATGIKAGASGSTISDTRELVQSVHNCGSTTTCANTANNSYREVLGAVTLSTGTATVSGISPAFTSTATFGCTGMDQTSAAVVKIVAASSSSITITGTGSDQIFYRCVGN